MKKIIIVHGPPGSGVVATARSLYGNGYHSPGIISKLILSENLTYKRSRKMLHKRYDEKFLASEFATILFSLQEQLEKSAPPRRIVIGWYFPTHAHRLQIAKLSRPLGYSLSFQEPKSNEWLNFCAAKITHEYNRPTTIKRIPFDLQSWALKFQSLTHQPFHVATIEKMLANFPFNLKEEDL